MGQYRITLMDRTTEDVTGVDAYTQEGPMTTFFRTDSERRVVDSWSTRVASFRTSEVLAIRRVEEAMAPVASLAACRTAS